VLPCAATVTSRALACLGLICAWATPAAMASPLGDPAIERAVFGGATQPGPQAMVVNPATLGLATGTHLHAGGSASLDRVSIDRRVVDPASGALADGPSARATLWSPGAAVGLYTVNSSGTFAAGLQARLPTSEAMIEDAAGVLAYHSMGGHHRELVPFVIGGAYRWRGLAVGASVQLVQNRVALRFARDTALEAGRDEVIGGTACDGGPCGFEHPAARELYAIDARTTWLPSAGNTVAATFGVVARLAPGWWIGAAYHAPPGVFSTVETTGHATVTRAPRDGGGALEGEATVRFSLPQRIRLGLRGRATDTLEVIAEARWEQLSTFRRYDVRLHGLELADAGIPELMVRPRGLRDQISVQAGLEQIDLGQRLVAGARLGFERGATARTRLSPLQVDPDGVTADLGLQLRIAPAWTVQLGYGLRWAPAAATGRGAYDPIARLDCIESGHNIDSPVCRQVREGYGLPTAAGTYRRIDNVARLGLQVTIQ
jgi:long-subunit fatty acid transport protein